MDVSCRGQEVTNPLPNNVVVIQQVNVDAPTGGGGRHDSVVQHPRAPDHPPHSLDGVSAGARSRNRRATAVRGLDGARAPQFLGALTNVAQTALLQVFRQTAAVVSDDESEYVSGVHADGYPSGVRVSRCIRSASPRTASRCGAVSSVTRVRTRPVELQGGTELQRCRRALDHLGQFGLEVCAAFGGSKGEDRAPDVLDCRVKVVTADSMRLVTSGTSLIRLTLCKLKPTANSRWMTRS